LRRELLRHMRSEMLGCPRCPAFPTPTQTSSSRPTVLDSHHTAIPFCISIVTSQFLFSEVSSWPRWLSPVNRCSILHVLAPVGAGFNSVHLFQHSIYLIVFRHSFYAAQTTNSRMTSTFNSATTTGADIAHALASTVGQANGVVKTTQEAPTPPSEGGRHQTRLKKKYRHVAALHARSQPSCLSHESETVPSFLGFRNLMVLVLSER
jgi:hypothetical protein